jgi:hypothetical protein
VNFVALCHIVRSCIAFTFHVTKEIATWLVNLCIVMYIFMDRLFTSCQISVCFAGRQMCQMFSIVDRCHSNFEL